MARIYVMNCTNQPKQLMWRQYFTLDDRGMRNTQNIDAPRMQTIPAGRQEPVGGDLSHEQIGLLIKQLSRYGLTHVSEARTAKMRGLVPMLYDLDKQVARNVGQDMVAHNQGVLILQGADRRRQAAIAIDSQLAQAVEHDIPKLEVEFEQLENNEEVTGNKPVADGIIIDKSATAPPRSSSRRGSSARKKAA